jgi:hypothetical protein
MARNKCAFFRIDVDLTSIESPISLHPNKKWSNLAGANGAVKPTSATDVIVQHVHNACYDDANGVVSEGLKRWSGVWRRSVCPSPILLSFPPYCTQILLSEEETNILY